MSLVDYKGRSLKIGNRVRVEVDIPSENGMLYKHSLVKLDEWNEITNLIPKITKNDKKMSKTNIAGLFSGSLELVKQGEINISQKKPFDKIFLKKI